MTDGIVRTGKRPARSHAAVKGNIGMDGRNHWGGNNNEDGDKKADQNAQHWMELLDGSCAMMFNPNG